MNPHYKMKLIKDFANCREVDCLSSSCQKDVNYMYFFITTNVRDKMTVIFSLIITEQTSGLKNYSIRHKEKCNDVSKQQERQEEFNKIRRDSDYGNHISSIRL